MSHTNSSVTDKLNGPGPHTTQCAAGHDSMSLTVSEDPIQRWLTSAELDAESRGLDELKPILQQFARATSALRALDARISDCQR